MLTAGTAWGCPQKRVLEFVCSDNALAPTCSLNKFQVVLGTQENVPSDVAFAPRLIFEEMGKLPKANCVPACLPLEQASETSRRTQGRLHRIR